VLGNLENQYFSVGGELSPGRKLGSLVGKRTAVGKEMWRERVRKKIRNGAPEMAGDIFEISRLMIDRLEDSKVES
jgi:hypothetical protein